MDANCAAYAEEAKLRDRIRQVGIMQALEEAHAYEPPTRRIREPDGRRFAPGQRKRRGTDDVRLDALEQAHRDQPYPDESPRVILTVNPDPVIPGRGQDRGAGSSGGEALVKADVPLGAKLIDDVAGKATTAAPAGQPSSSPTVRWMQQHGLDHLW